jgi:hypothetical protein
LLAARSRSLVGSFYVDDETNGCGLSRSGYCQIAPSVAPIEILESLRTLLDECIIDEDDKYYSAGIEQAKDRYYGPQ